MSREELSRNELPGMLAVAKAVSEQRWPHTMDAKLWADEFVKLNPGADHDLMLGWFANAIMAGYDTAQHRASRSEKPASIDLGSYVNAAEISAADAPHIVVEKLQKAIKNAAPQVNPQSGDSRQPMCHAGESTTADREPAGAAPSTPSATALNDELAHTPMTDAEVQRHIKNGISFGTDFIDFCRQMERAADAAWVNRDNPSANTGSEYICKCGLRVTPHRCQTGTDF